MPQNFLSCDRDQPMLLPPDLRDWLAEDHLAWFVIEAIEELDLEPFYASYRADGHGRAAHDPKMMVTLLTYAYAVGERSSRGIERRCREDVAFRVICATRFPTTPRSPASGSATRRPSETSSARSSPSAPRPDWSRSA
jgi:transposase